MFVFPLSQLFWESEQSSEYSTSYSIFTLQDVVFCERNLLVDYKGPTLLAIMIKCAVGEPLVDQVVVYTYHNKTCHATQPIFGMEFCTGPFSPPPPPNLAILYGIYSPSTKVL